MNIDVRKFDPKYLEALYHAFQAAWDDTPSSFNLPFEHFRSRIQFKLNIDPGYSLLAFQDHQIVGFILNTINQYKGKCCAYNGGTGVIPTARGIGLTEKLYRELIPKLAKNHVDAALLEVVTNNKKAIHIYQKIGFNITQHFKCFACRRTTVVGNKTQIFQVKTPKKIYKTFWDIEPSFLDQTQQLTFNLSQEMILEALYEGKIIGYIIFQPHLGRISQLAVHPDYRHHGFGSELLQEAGKYSNHKYLTIMNIPSDATSIILFLASNGFLNEIDQYEMELII